MWLCDIGEMAGLKIKDCSSSLARSCACACYSRSTVSPEAPEANSAVQKMQAGRFMARVSQASAP